jgi:hypothetical protein
VPELELEPELPLPDVLGADGAGLVVLGVLGALVLPEALPDVELWPDVLPLVVLPEAEPEAASFMQRSFSAPRRVAHFSVPTLAPAEPLVEVEGLVEVDGVCELVLAPAPAEPLVEVEGFAACELVLAPAPAEPLLIEPDGAAGLVCALVLPLEDDLLASFADTAPDSARSAAAVELTRIFSIMCVLLRLKKR